MCGCVRFSDMTDGIGLLIRRARERKRMTQQELSDALDVDRSAVSNWETGVHFPLRHAGRIEELLDIKIPAPPRADDASDGKVPGMTSQEVA